MGKDVDKPTLDHIVVGAQTLEAGLSYIREVLGVYMPPSGMHPLMGTHNGLMRIGADVFLEVIAVDPASPTPSRRRWFALDDDEQQARLREKPRIIAWVARTQTLDAHLSASSADLGRPIAASRGGLNWRIGVRDDGSLPEQGLLPVLIEWPNGQNPSGQMPEYGIRLKCLRLYSPRPGSLSGNLRRLRSNELVEIVSCPDGDDPRIEVQFWNSTTGTSVTLT